MGKGAARISDICTGHPRGSPRPNNQGSPDVFINGRRAHRQSDSWPVHRRRRNHKSFLAAGSPSVYTNGLQQGRIGDPVACGSRVKTGSTNVFIGGRLPITPSNLFRGGGFDPPRPLSRSEREGLVANGRNPQQFLNPNGTIPDDGGINPEPGPHENLAVTDTPVRWDECDDQDLSLSANQRVYNNARQRLAEAKTGAWQAGGNNPNIMQLYRDVGVPQSSDSTHWCAAFAGSVLKRSCTDYTRSLRAQSYNNIGQPLDRNNPSALQPGDIVVFTRGDPRSGQGHVAIVDRYDPATNRIFYIGGNQGGRNVTLGSRVYNPNNIVGLNRPQ